MADEQVDQEQKDEDMYGELALKANAFINAPENETWRTFWETTRDIYKESLVIIASPERNKSSSEIAANSLLSANLSGQITVITNILEQPGKFIDKYKEIVAMKEQAGKKETA